MDFIDFLERNLPYLYHYPHTLKRWVLSIIAIIGVIYVLINFIVKCYSTIQNWKNKDKNILDDESLYNKYVPLIEKYISDKSDAPHISLRLVASKNYNRMQHEYVPSDDCFAFQIWMEYFDGRLIDKSWVDSTGIWLDRTPSGMVSSLYVNNKNRIFFFDDHGKRYTGFKEYVRFRFVVKLPFKNIISIDINNIVGYEPVVYTKHHYSNQKIWSDGCFIKEYYGDDPFRVPLRQKLKMKRYSKLGYVLKIIKFYTGRDNNHICWK